MPRRRVVITGMGAVSSIGTGLAAIESALREGRSGIRRVPEWGEMGIESQVAGVPEAEPDCPLLTRRVEKNSTSVARMALFAAHEALRGAGLDPLGLRGQRLAVLIGSGSASTLQNFLSCRDLERTGTTRRVTPYTVPRVMGSTAAANVSVALGTTGESWSVSSACSTGAHAIGLGALMIRWGRYDRILAGAAEELDWTRVGAFDAMRALSRGYNDRPEQASRPFDVRRDGFVISGGAGVVVLEELEAARRRGAPILAEVAGYGANSDGHDMVLPDTRGAVNVMREALADAGIAPEEVGYVNAHGTSTPHGDPSEAAAMGEVFGRRQPWLSSTKSITGHAIGAAGALEVIYTVLMMRGGFLAPSRNLDEIDPSCAHLRFVREPDNDIAVTVAMSNSFGFGGTNASLVLRLVEPAGQPPRSAAS
ncbi:MAG: beta-ketoacyl-[acyl-carrier-protein] synthase family protein [Acidobacteria bacterium]|nr:MAG: beta-ketoacyl-[acyl-carrier-protein] synthase family protein [Acidobacteriota bacterium]